MRYVILIVIFLYAAPTWASEVEIIQSWARASAPGQDSGAVYLRIVSQQDARIIAVTSTVADSAEIHSMTQENGVMKMRGLASLSLPARQEVELGSGGSHIMLNGLKKLLKVGDIVPLTLTIQFTDKRKEKIEVKAEVKPLIADNSRHEHHHDH